MALQAEVAGQPVAWTERRLVVRSRKLATAQEQTVRRRLSQAQAELAALNERRQGKKRFTGAAELAAAAEQIVKARHVAGLLDLRIETQTTERPRRPYGSRPADVQVEQTWTVTVGLNELALAETLQSLGWRVYATNQPARQLSVTQAVLAYRAEYLVEHGFGHWKGKSLALPPISGLGHAGHRADSLADDCPAGIDLARIWCPPALTGGGGDGGRPLSRQPQAGYRPPNDRADVAGL